MGCRVGLNNALCVCVCVYEGERLEETEINEWIWMIYFYNSVTTYVIHEVHLMMILIDWNM
jgi:hypothetical protein